MTRTTTKTDDATIAGGPVAAPRVVRQRRIRRGQLGLAVLLVALGALGSLSAFAAVKMTEECLAVARPVAAGTQLTAADLTTVEINTAPGLSPIPASKLNEVLGKRAAVSLVSGTLLSAQQLTDESLVGPGKQQVSIGLKPERLPAQKLSPGDQVQLVATAGDAAVGAGNPQLGPAEKFDGTVVDTSSPGSDGTVVVYVAVPAIDAPKIANLNADGRMTMVLKAVR